MQAGGAAIALSFAGCSSDTNDSNSGGVQDNTEEPQQQYTIPPVVELKSTGVPEDGVVTVRSVFETVTNPGDPNVYFEDELKFELFVYDTFPVGNDVTLTKVAEKTSTPHGVFEEVLEVPFSDLPKNEQMRFRLKVTNVDEGKSGWQMDQRVFLMLYMMICLFLLQKLIIQLLKGLVQLIIIDSVS